MKLLGELAELADLELVPEQAAERALELVADQAVERAALIPAASLEVVEKSLEGAVLGCLLGRVWKAGIRWI